LTNNSLFISRGKLGRLASFVVFFVQIHFLLDPSNSRPSYTSLGLNLAKRIAFFKKRNHSRMLRGGCGLHGKIKKMK